MLQIIIDNQDNIAEALGAIIALLAVIVRLTPSKTDDGLFAKIDYWFNKVLDFLKIPNPRKKDK